MRRNLMAAPGGLIRGDRSAGSLRALARRERSRSAAARTYAVVNALEGMNRAEAARLAGLERQALRDAVASVRAAVRATPARLSRVVRKLGFSCQKAIACDPPDGPGAHGAMSEADRASAREAACAIAGSPVVNAHRVLRPALYLGAPVRRRPSCHRRGLRPRAARSLDPGRCRCSSTGSPPR